MERQAWLDLMDGPLSAFLNSRRRGSYVWAQAVLAAAYRFEITTQKRLGALVANLVHESNNFLDLEEDGDYSAKRLTIVWPKRFPTVELAAPYAHNPVKLFNFIYANRNGNGDEKSGDGYRYRGRGPLQWTGEDNYGAPMRCSGRGQYQHQAKVQGLQLLENPDLLLQSGPGCFWAAWWWDQRGLNQLADLGDLLKITKVINGGTMGFDHRALAYKQALQFLPAA